MTDHPMPPFLPLLLAAVVLPWAAAPAAAQGDAPMVLCDSCKNRGERECNGHRKLLELERRVLRCSEAAACRRCGGALATDCKFCTNAPVQTALEERRRLAQEFRERRLALAAEYTRGGGDEIMHVETANLDLGFRAWPLTVGRTKLDNHEAMHLYADRIETLRREFMATFELADRDFPRHASDEDSPRLHVWIVRDPEELRAISPRETGMGSGGSGVKLMGIRLAYVVAHDRKLFRDDAALHRNVVHSIAHLLLSSMNPTVWIGNRGHGWIDEGVAHYFEYRVDGLCTNFCFEEIALQPGAGFKGGAWRVAIRKQLEAGKLVPFVDFYQKNSDQLDFAEHAQAFAAVEFLIARSGGRKFADFVRAVKADTPTRDAMVAAFGLAPLQFDDAFHAWVRETYPLQKR